MTIFEDLSDEILMDIFDSLTLPIEIYSSFFNLNQRLNEILRDSRLLMSIDLSSTKRIDDFLYHCQIMFPQMTKQLISLRLSNDENFSEQIEIFLRYQRLNSFEYLRQLSLIQIRFDQLRRTFVDIISLKHLIRLDIDMFDCSGVTPNELNRLANIFISKSKSIRTLNLRFNRECFISDSPSENLKDFSLDSCFINDFPQLLRLSSNLHRLKVKVEQTNHRTTIEFPMNFISLLKEFHFEINDLNFDDIQRLILFLPNLEIFRLEGLSYDLNLCKGELWQNLLEKHLKNLKRFHFNSLRIWLGNNADDHHNENSTNLIQDIYRSFGKTNSFWRKFSSVEQMHKLRPNHLALTIRAERFRL